LLWRLCVVSLLRLASPSLALADDVSPEAVAPPAPRSLAVAIPIEVLSPVGAAGCFYRRRYVSGAIVALGSLFTGGTFIYAVATQDRDGAILNAVGYGLLRVLGVVEAARADGATPAAPTSAPVEPRASFLVPASDRHAGFSYGFSF